MNLISWYTFLNSKLKIVVEYMLNKMLDVLSNKRIEKSYDAISDCFGYDFES